MRSFVKQAFSYDDAVRSLKSWSDRGIINMTYDEIDKKRKNNPKQLLAIYWTYVRKWRDEKLSKKASLRTFAVQSVIEVVNPTCQNLECDRSVLAYNYCVQHFQRFVVSRYPKATREQIQAYLATLQPRALVQHAVIIEPVKPVTPSGSQTPQSMDAPGDPHPNQPNKDTSDKGKQKKQPVKKEEKKQESTEQKQQIEEMTQKVVDQLSNAFGDLRGFSKQGYGASFKYRERLLEKRRKAKPKKEDSDIDEELQVAPRDYGYERNSRVNFPGAGGQSYFTPYVAVLKAEKLLKKQAQVWAEDGLSEREIKKRLQPYTDRVNKFKKRKPVATPSPIERSPEKDPNLLTPKI